MSLDSVFAGSKVRDLTASPQQSEYTGVIVNTSDDTYVSAGDVDSANAKVLEVSADWATVADAQRILARLQGFQYQPYAATDAHLDPAAELGDAVTVGKVYSGIFSQGLNFNSVEISSDVSAPQEEQIDNEYKYVSPQKREYKRKFAEVRASIQIEADRITAEVERATAAEGTLSSRITQTADAITSEVTRATTAEGNLSTRITQNASTISAEVSRATTAEGSKLDHTHTSSTFGWELTASAFLLKSNNATVFKCDKDGVEITGKITAKSGYIGNGSSGFTISASAIYNGMTSLSDTAHNGVYVGTDGIALGKGAFKVDSQGNLTANSGVFKGQVSAGAINYGGADGTFDGWGLTGGSVGTYPMTGGVNTSLGYGDFANEVFNLGTQAAFGNFNSCITQFLHTDNINVADRNLTLKTATVRNASGSGTTTIYYLGYN